MIPSGFLQRERAKLAQWLFAAAPGYAVALREKWGRRANWQQVSYSQCGEDLILQYLLMQLGIERPSYLDIGAHHSRHLSNTYLFYQAGGKGVCVEPNPELHREIQRNRPRDVCLNVGIGTASAGSMNFYVFDHSELSTFSETILETLTARGLTVQKVLSVPLEPVNKLLETHFATRPDLVSLDTEGLDLEILQSFDFSNYRPAAFCIETIGNADQKKVPAIFEFMHERGYATYADTHINTIFVDDELWQRYLASQLTDGESTLR